MSTRKRSRKPSRQDNNTDASVPANQNSFVESSSEQTDDATEARDSDGEYTEVSLNSCEVCERKSTAASASEKSDEAPEPPAPEADDSSSRESQEAVESTNETRASHAQYAKTVGLTPVTVTRESNATAPCDDDPQPIVRPTSLAAGKAVRRPKWLSARVLISLSLAAAIALAGTAVWTNQQAPTHIAQPVAMGIQGEALATPEVQEKAKSETPVNVPAKVESVRDKDTPRMARGNTAGNMRHAVLKTQTTKYATLAKAHKSSASKSTTAAKGLKSQVKKGHAQLQAKKQPKKDTASQRS